MASVKPITHLLPILAIGLMSAPGVADADEEGTPTRVAENQPADADSTVSSDTAVAAEVPHEALAGYKKGFFIHSEDGAFSLGISGRVQGRYTFEDLDTGADRDEVSNFAVQRARLKLKGHAFTKDIKYVLQMDMGKGNVVLKDFTIDRRLGGGDVWLRAGQWKRPFSRQQINSSGKLALVDRAITDKAFGSGRDIGVAIHNRYDKSPDGLEWVVGVFNATGDKPKFSGTADPMTGDVTGKFSDVPRLFGPAIVARVGFNSGGIKGYSEADMKGGPLRYAVAASGLVELDADDDNNSSIRTELDYVVKTHGLSTTGAVYFATAQDGMDFADQGTAQIGAHLQAGYMITDSLEPVVRVAMVAPDGSDNNVIELTGGLSFYEFGHGFKWQTDFSLFNKQEMGGSINDFQARTQLQLAF